MTSRRGFIGALGVAVAGFLGLGAGSLFRKRNEQHNSHKNELRAEQIAPERLAKFNRVLHGYGRTAYESDIIYASAPASDLDWSQLRNDLNAQRYVQDEGGECKRLVPVEVLQDKGRGQVEWTFRLLPA